MNVLFAIWFKMPGLSGVILAAILLSGCGQAPLPKFAQDCNAKRQELGLPVIATGWVNYNQANNGQEAAWRTPGSNQHAPNHYGKKVLYASGQWEMEQDYYYSGKTFPADDPDGGTEWEEVTVSYAFVEHPGYPQGWTCHYKGPANRGERRIKLEEAEKILASWGIKRLNY